MAAFMPRYASEAGQRRRTREKANPLGLYLY